MTGAAGADIPLIVLGTHSSAAQAAAHGRKANRDISQADLFIVSRILMVRPRCPSLRLNFRQAKRIHADVLIDASVRVVSPQVTD